jgi:hypothetical protein
MFFVECASHESGFVLLNIDRIVATRNTRDGIELDWECWCGNRGTWRPRHDAAPAAA